MKYNLPNLPNTCYYTLVALIFFLPIITKASHVQGGDITYRCLGGNQYEITVAIYRDCAGANLGNTISVKRQSTTCNINTSFTLNKIQNTGNEVSPICPGSSTKCTGGTLPGVQEYIYRGVVTLSACSDWTLSYSLNARNSAINTIQSPGSQNMYIEATLNNLNFPCNNSPTFTNKPVPYICVGQPYCYNNGSNDTDGDSLVYTLITPKTSATSNITYTGGYTATQPLASTPAAQFNNITGDLCVNPTMLQVTVIAVRVAEYRNNVLIGSVMRDIQIQTKTCTNNNPSLSGINGTGTYTMNTCAGNTITFNIPTSDADNAQNLTLSWNAGISGATFNPGTGNRPTGIFSWTPTGADVSFVPHCFTVTVKDDACPYVGSQTYAFCITVGGFGATVQKTNASCTTHNGNATINITGGATPISYSWTPSSIAGNVPTASNLAAGTYTCTVSDIANCTQTIPITINADTGGTALIGTYSDVSCNGGSNGSITVSMTGTATPPFTYQWSPASAGTGVTASNLSPGTYTCTVTDANGCVTTVSKVITEPAVLTVNKTFTNVGCFGGNTGTATASPTGGTAPYTYLWMPGAYNTASIGSLPIGTYSVTTTDSRGCTANTTVNIVEPPVLAATITSVTAASCGQTNGSATVAGSGGFPGAYTYLWMPGGQTNATATGLAAGTYTVTITDLNLCTTSVPVTVGSVAGPSAQIATTTNVSCFGGNNGNATVNTTGGTQPITYLWSNGQTTPTAGNLAAGIYSVQATDGLGCIASASVTITQPSVLNVNAVSTSPTCFGSTNGTATASAVGGTSPYNYSWTANGNPTTATVNGIGAGTYNVTVTDAKGCIKTTSATVTNPPALVTNISKTDVTCYGLCNGSATATVTNGTAPYAGHWNTPMGQTGLTLNNLCAGNYTISVTDANGCTSQAVVTITQPPVLAGTVTSKANLDCYGVCTGFAQTTTIGGTAPYTYNWMPGNTNNATNSALCAGTYTCTVTDSKGCTDTAVANITQPTPLIATAVGTDIKCFGVCDGTGNIIFSGGTPPYTPLWTPSMQTIFNPNNLCPGTHIGKVTDSKGCSASDSITLAQNNPPITISTSTTSSNCSQSNGGACANVTGGLAPYTYVWSDSVVSQASCANAIPAGSYTVEVTDATGCISTAVANVNDISSPTVNITNHTDLLCYGATTATATINVSGGVGPYTQVWIPGGQTLANPTTLGGGVNTVKVTDAAGCIASASVTIVEPPVINHAIASTTHISCFNQCDGSATAVAAGGTGTLTFLWDDPAAQATAIATALCAGTRIVSIKDGNNCMVYDTTTIITEPNALNIVSSTATNITCYGDDDGSITPVISGGTPFYTFAWTPTGGSDPIATGLAPGTYTVTVTDQNGCTATQNWTLTEPPALTDTVVTTSANCGQSNGTATVTANGGTPPYTYQWNDPSLQTVPNAITLNGSTYSIIVTDSQGCSITKSAVIADLSGPVVDSVTTTHVFCYGGNTGTATVHLAASMGTAPFVFAWSPATQTDSTATALTQGTYSVTITDDAGCTATGVAIVNEPPVLELFATVSDTICSGDTIQLYATASGGTQPYTYSWLNPSGNTFTGSGIFNEIPSGNTHYTAAVIDNSGCTTDTIDIFITVRPPLSIHAIDTTICENDSALLHVAINNGSLGPFTYLWYNGSTAESLLVKPVGTATTNYIVSVSDGCSAPIADTSTVTITPAPLGTFYALPPTGCVPFTTTATAISNTGTSYFWNFGDGHTSSENPTTYTYTSTGAYTISVAITTPTGCTSIIDSTAYITVNALPTAAFTADFSMSPTVVFTDLSTATITNWFWDFGDIATLTTDTSTVQNPTYQYPREGTATVTLIVTNQYGCKDTTQQPIDIIELYQFYAPNSFSPNEDGLNDVFIPKVVGFDVSTFEMLIFSRWGQLIYYTDDYTKGWNGIANHGAELAQHDVYVWKVSLIDNQGLPHTYNGTVTLLK